MTTHARRENPPSSREIVGSAVATIVLSRELSIMPSCSPTKMSQSRRGLSAVAVPPVVAVTGAALHTPDATDPPQRCGGSVRVLRCDGKS